MSLLNNRTFRGWRGRRLGMAVDMGRFADFASLITLWIPESPSWSNVQVADGGDH